MAAAAGYDENGFCSVVFSSSRRRAKSTVVTLCVRTRARTGKWKGKERNIAPAWIVYQDFPTRFVRRAQTRRSLFAVVCRPGGRQRFISSSSSSFFFPRTVMRVGCVPCARAQSKEAHNTPPKAAVAPRRSETAHSNAGGRTSTRKPAGHCRGHARFTRTISV